MNSPHYKLLYLITITSFSLQIFGCCDESCVNDNACDGGDGDSDGDADSDGDGDSSAHGDGDTDSDSDTDGDETDSGDEADGDSDNGHPLTCDERPRACGEIPDGSGGVIDCGGCTSPLQCGPDNTCECIEPDCRILCDGETFDGYDSRLFQLDHGDSGSVIRDCVFRNSSSQAIGIEGASNILIEGCLFESLRAGVPDRDLHAINIPREGHNVTIRNCEFVDIGADGVQLGHYNGDIDHINILDNVFRVTNDDVGENGVDIKSTAGPIVVAGNDFFGFRPCEEGQDCTGSDGPAMVVHSGSNGPATGVTIEGNRFWDSRLGLVVAAGSQGHPPENIIVTNNWFFGNLSFGLRMDRVRDIELLHNTFYSNGDTHLRIRNTPAGGGSCRNANNLFVGSGEADDGCDPFGNLSLSEDEAALVGAESGDLHLGAGSLAIDRGTPLPEVTTDIDGEERPRGDAPDVGADEAL